MKIVSALLGCGLITAAIVMGSPLWVFINIPSVIIVFGGAFCFSLAHHSREDIQSAIQNALSDRWSINAHRDIAVLATIRKAVYGSGVVGTLIGLIQMLQSLDDPSSIGPAMAVALLTVLYSVLLAEFFVDPMTNRILAAAPVDPGTSSKTPPAQSAHAVGMVFGAIISFFILIVALN